MLAIETHDLSKAYGRKEVLHRVHLRVGEGKLFGFLGPNGAGKTTTIRILLGLLRATRGCARVLGRAAWADGARVRAEVGYLAGDVRFYSGLTGRQTLEFLAAARRIDVAAEVVRLQRRFDLDLSKRVRVYSRGMKQKLGLMQALMHRPRLVILDEPTIALDPLVRQVLYEELREAVGGGRTVLFSSHTLPEVEALCDEVAIVRDGHLVEQARIETLRSRALRHVEIRFSREGRRPPTPVELTVRRATERHLTGTWVGAVGPLIEWLGQAGVEDVSIGAPDLEDLFLAYYERDGGRR